MQYLGAKQPYEEYPVLFDFTNYLGTDDVASATVNAIDMEDDSDVTATVTDVTEQSISSKYVYVRVRGGTDGHKYQLTCRVVSDNGAKYELDGILPVNAQ